MNGPRIVIAATHGDLGGGEVMLLHVAQALQGLGLTVLVLAPAEPGDLLRAARERGVPTLPVPGRGRRGYATALLRWRLRHPRVPLWCNGLLPALATAGIGPRVVHLHQLPRGGQRRLLPLATAGARRVLVPSAFMASRVPGTEVLENWTEELPERSAAAPAPPEDPVRVGFLGRLTRDKGVHVLARALQLLPTVGERPVHLVLAGEARFGDAEDARVLAASLAPITERTERLGWVERRTFFDRVDLAVFPSVVEESFGLVVAEAMAAGVPFVTSDAGALPEIAGGTRACSARRDDPEDLARVLALALAGPYPVAAVRAARARWERCYSPAAGRERLHRLLRELDAPRARPGTLAPSGTPAPRGRRAL